MLKGLKFTPTPDKSEKHTYIQDIDKFIAKLRVSEHFHGTSFSDESLVSNTSTFVPPRNQNHNLEMFIQNIKNIPLSCPKKFNKFNITLLERKAISSLQENSEIVIKEADKGGAVVIMNSSFYKSLCEETLHDANYYQPLNNDPSSEMKTRYKHIT